MPNSPRPLKVFLCYARDDRNAVIDLYQRLVSEGIDPWMDKEKLLPGQDWKTEIAKAVEQSDLVIVCLSKGFSQKGFRQKEIRFVLDTAAEYPDETVFVIPALLEDCDVPRGLRHWHWVNLFEDGGISKLLNAFTMRAEQIGALPPRKVLESLLKENSRNSGNPFRGLISFKEEDAEIFNELGRSGDANKVLNLLKDTATQVVILYGGPGVGKTSLIQAGVLPRLKEDKPWIIQNLAFGRLDPQKPDDIELFIQKLHALSQEKNKKFLLVCDQLEYWYEQSKTARETVLRVLSAVVKETPFKLLIGVRREYVLELVIQNHFPDKNAVKTIELNRLTVEQATTAITRLTKDVFFRSAAEKLVLILAESEQSVGDDASQDRLKPYTPYIQIVCEELWKQLIIEQNKSNVRSDAIDKEQVRKIIDNYLENKIPITDPPELGTKILRSLVKRGHTDAIVPNPMTIEDLVQECQAGHAQVSSFIQKLCSDDLVYFQRADSEGKVQIMNDFLGTVIFNKYDSLSVAFRQAIDSLMESFGIISNAEMDEADRERNILVFAQDFLVQRYSSYINDLTGKERSTVLEHLIFQTNTSHGLLKRLLNDNKVEKARLVMDVIYQLLLLLKEYDKIERFCRNIRDLIQENLSSENDKTLNALLEHYQTEHSSCWQAALDNTSVLDEKHEDYIAMQHILRAAQQEREYTFVELLDRLKSFKITRLHLWRLLYRLWQDGEVSNPAPSVDGIFHALFSYDWVLSPDRPYLEKYNAVEDLRTYQGVLVHIPAGEHAMRNQRVARQWLIRTVAVERSSRTTAPGWHEADDKKIIESYSDEKFTDLLHRVAQDYAVMLNESDKKMWVILEAQEYQVHKMVEVCRKVNEELRNKEHSFEGSIVTDIGASIANRKDLTRGIATIAGVPQPSHIILALKPEPEWRNIWQKAIEQPNLVKWLPSNWDTLSEPEQKKIWMNSLREAVGIVGGSAMVKPITTEFLKGATPISLKENDLELAWERARKAIGFPSVVVEKLIPNIRKELLVIVVRRPDGTYVSIPPIWYRCVRDFNWQADGKHQSVPVALDYAWVNRNVQPQDSQDMRDGWEDDQRTYEQAWSYSKTVAETLWSEIEYAGHEVNNRFLEFEWLVLENGELLLNEIKPTQLDKGIISNYAFDYSDSDLLVRNLFGLPLPEQVRLIRPQETILCGAVLTTESHDVQMITKGRQLIGYDNIAAALRLGAQVFLYSDKMRSLPYIGRRMGILTVSKDILEEAKKTFFNARSVLFPRYETHGA